MKVDCQCVCENQRKLKKKKDRMKFYLKMEKGRVKKQPDTVFLHVK